MTDFPAATQRARVRVPLRFTDGYSVDAELVTFHGLTDGVLQLSTPSQIAADRIKSQYLDAILHAAEVAEVFVERVVITLRKDQR